MAVPSTKCPTVPNSHWQTVLHSAQLTLSNSAPQCPTRIGKQCSIVPNSHCPTVLHSAQLALANSAP
ncbi:hypothetical protein RRG08_020005 [Elysia crispata]|uniref:Uncharacterized protein n=1 Tax=Elysia crispata TaxID=231223 RepID=A0AAE1ECU5_9GAST|nr:hypothetical protein RRG08_020005 [Elysia crispata]